jgi:hypothetical protein
MDLCIRSGYGLTEKMGALPTAESLPAPLVTREQWVAWRSEERSGKATKVPVNPATGSYASATDAETWTDFATAREYAASSARGVGFVFTADDPIVGVDLDDCRDPDDGSLTDWAQDIVDRLDSFTEVSPSGTGVHVLVEGELPDGRNRHGDVELYDDARFFTVTGDQLSETPGTLEQRQDALVAVHTEYVAPDDAGGSASADADSEATAGAADTPESAAAASDGAASGPGNDLGDEELLSRARSATNGEKFARLFAGDTAGYPSQSEADMALCSLLAFWTGGDAEQMDRLFRESGWCVRSGTRCILPTERRTGSGRSSGPSLGPTSSMLALVILGGAFRVEPVPLSVVAMCPLLRPKPSQTVRPCPSTWSRSWRPNCSGSSPRRRRYSRNLRRNVSSGKRCKQRSRRFVPTRLLRGGCSGSAGGEVRQEQPSRARKPPLARLGGLAAVLGRVAPCGPCVARRRRASGPFQSHPVQASE